MTRTRRIQYHRYGGPEVLQLDDVDLPPLRAGEVLVRVRAAAANPMDWEIRSGRLKAVTGRRFPRGLGHDFAGVVESVGDGVTRLRVGDAVLGGASLKAAGAFAELVVAAEAAVVKKPANVSFVDAATLPVASVTGYQAMITAGRLQPGQSVFITGCLGSVGRAATQFALALGASVGGSCRATARQDARELGVDPVVDLVFDPAPLAARFDLVLDTSGQLPIRTARRLIKPGGKIIDLKPTPVKLLRSILPGPFHALIGSANSADLECVARAAERGTLRLPIARVVPLDDAIAALTDLEHGVGAKGGKLVVTFGG